MKKKLLNEKLNEITERKKHKSLNIKMFILHKMWFCLNK